MASNKCRDVIFYKIKDNIANGGDFYVINSDFTGRPFIDIEREYPNRFVQVGIAEQNMIAVACGLALEGKKVVTFSPNPFMYLRAYDQIRNGISVMNLPVVIVGNGSALINTALGATHLNTEYYQLFSLLPNFKSFIISDVSLAEAVADKIIEGVPTPTYVLVDFYCDETFENEEELNLEKGFRYLKRGDQNLVIVQGYMTKIVLNSKFKSNPAIIDAFSQPFSDLFWKEIKQYSKIVVVEEQQLRGGLGSHILEGLNKRNINIPVKRLGIDYGDHFPQFFGDREFFLKSFNIDEDAISKAVDDLKDE